MASRRLVDHATMRLVDAAACGLPGNSAGILMERAARAACDLALGFPVPERVPILVLAGPGNNGADALLCAALLAEAGRRVEVWQVPGRSGRTTELWGVQAKRLAAAGIRLATWDGAPAGSWGLAIEGLAGVGLSAPLEGSLAAAAAWLNSRAIPVVLSLDLPGGLYDGWRAGEPAVRASHTICFGLAKLCLYMPAARLLAGQISVADIGLADPTISAGAISAGPVPGAPAIPGTASLLLASDLSRFVPSIPPDAHKFMRGSVALVAGSLQYPGALELSVRAALNSRAGLVHAVSDAGVFASLPGLPPEVLRHDPPAGAGGLVAALPARFDALGVGPGWGRGEARVADLRALAARCRELGVPLVLDADGLHALGRTGPLQHAGMVLTPHAGEMAALAGCPPEELAQDPRPALASLAKHHGAVILFKGAVTWIVDPTGQFSVYDGANPLLAQAGSGDILAGIIVAVLAGLRRTEMSVEAACLAAACAGCLCLARAGQIAWRNHGWVAASGVVAMLPAVWAEAAPAGLRGTEFAEEVP